MYAAKADGNHGVRIFEPSMHQRALDRLELGGELPYAVHNEELELDYQPIVELESGRIAGVEALVRWRHPQRGRLGPSEFIGLAEQTGSIVPIGEWVLRTACRQLRRWSDELPAELVPYMSINVSVRQLDDPSFADVLAHTLELTGVPASKIVLEITESMLTRDANAMIDQLHRLHAIGVRVAVDDFGTGFSMLSTLHRFPVDIVKLDRSFVLGLETDLTRASLIGCVVGLGESLSFETIAEGIEEPGQAEHLRALQLPLCQGFLFARPMPPEEVRNLLEQGVVTVPEAA